MGKFTIASLAVAMLGASVAGVVAAPEASAAPFRSCDEAYTAGAAPLYAGQPGYSRKLDRDGDGVACEAGVPAAPPAVPVGHFCPAASSNDSGFAVVGCQCVMNSSEATAADGSTAYCRRLQQTDAYMWSLRNAEITHPNSVLGYEGTDPTMYVCMEQTGRSATDCTGYLSSPNYPGDGGAPR